MNYRQTEQECSLCDGNMVLHDNDLFCKDCGYVPEPRLLEQRNSWQHFWFVRQKAGERGERKWCVGGCPWAYENTL